MYWKLQKLSIDIHHWIDRAPLRMKNTRGEVEVFNKM